MIAIHIRRFAMQRHHETGQSIQEILMEIVSALRTGVVDHRTRKCPLCNSDQTIVSSTRASDDATTRHHKCNFCGWSFRSEEKKSVISTGEVPQTIVKRKKKK